MCPPSSLGFCWCGFLFFARHFFAVPNTTKRYAHNATSPPRGNTRGITNNQSARTQHTNKRHPNATQATRFCFVCDVTPSQKATKKTHAPSSQTPNQPSHKKKAKATGVNHSQVHFHFWLCCGWWMQKGITNPLKDKKAKPPPHHPTLTQTQSTARANEPSKHALVVVVVVVVVVPPNFPCGLTLTLVRAPGNIILSTATMPSVVFFFFCFFPLFFLAQLLLFLPFLPSGFSRASVAPSLLLSPGCFLMAVEH